MTCLKRQKRKKKDFIPINNDINNLFRLLGMEPTRYFFKVKLTLEDFNKVEKKYFPLMALPVKNSFFT